MSEYVQRFFNRFRGGGLIANDPLVLTSTDASGNAYVAADYEGSYLVEMKLQDIATLLKRVKKWKVTIDVEVDDGSSTDTLTTVIETPSTVYERISAVWTGSAFDYSGSTVEVADEKAANIYNQTPFEYFNIQHEPGGNHGLSNVFIEWARPGESFDYYAKTLPDLETAFESKPNTLAYFPINIEGHYFDDGNFADSLFFDFYTKISNSGIDYDKADLNKETGVVNLKFMGVDVSSDLYWIEKNGETGYTFTISITIEPAATSAYWTYGGKFNTNTGVAT